ncbi:MAG TPA: Gfo/Idh/MocA family oxidoreductase [Steroidobacteraceae bacterium]|jgi:predicted dehydrogenase|nr:Gfo/Idh/MocA family oxidoreductase [Steroidobacteraceae bacterium]
MIGRRKFIAAAAAAAVVPFIGTRVRRARAAQSGKKLGFALCGLGDLSEQQIAPALQVTERCRLAGVITDTPAKAAAWRTRYGIPVRSVYTYDTMHRMADNADIDVVYIVTPNALHLDHATAAARAGKHVLCEKPMEVSVERCQKMIDTIRRAGRMLAVAYRCQFEPHHLECIRLARSGEFGALKVIDAYFGFRIEPAVWRLKRALSGGGPLLDVGVYALQVTRYLTGEEPIWVSGITTSSDPTRFSEVEESVLWEARFPGGAVSHCGASYNSAPVGYFRAIAERGWFALDPAFNYQGIRGLRSDGKAMDYPPINQFAAEMDDFARCILENTPSRVSGEEGLRDVRIMMAIYESARGGRPVELTSS